MKPTSAPVDHPTDGGLVSPEGELSRGDRTNPTPGRSGRQAAGGYRCDPGRLAAARPSEDSAGKAQRGPPASDHRATDFAECDGVKPSQLLYLFTPGETGTHRTLPNFKGSGP